MTPQRSRRTVLAGLLVATGALAALILFDVLGTVFFAITVAYLLVPVRRRLVARGVPARTASAVTTLGATGAALVPLEVIAYLVYQRRDALHDLVENLPDTFPVEFAGVTYTLHLATVVDTVQAFVSSLAVDALSAAGILALKFALFLLLVFGLLMRYREAAAAVLAPIPPEYHDVARALHVRTRDTLYAIYVLQAATGLATALVAYPVFYLLGYEYALTFAVVAGLLQFLPVVGPSVLVVALAAYQVSVGAVVDAVLVLVLGSVFVAGLPDIAVRPWLARQTAHLSGSLYFVGFVGGLLTVGPVGIIAGPLVVALLSESLTMLADEMRPALPEDFD